MRARTLPLRFVPPALLALGAATLAGGPAAAQRVGIDAAVNTDATGTPPGAAARQLIIGQDVVHNEHITTNDQGQTQLLFVDGSSVSIGPQADMTIDDFVYNPSTGAGKMTLTTLKGAMRFVGGKLSKEDNQVAVNLPAATIGVRGGVFIADVRPDGNSEVIFVFGKALTITGRNGARQQLFRPGFAVDIDPMGRISPPHPAPPGATLDILTQLDGRSGGNGGATTVPTNTTVANSGIPNTISNNVTASIQQATQNSTTPFPTTTTPPSPQPQQVQTNQTQVVTVAPTITTTSTTATGTSVNGTFNIIPRNPTTAGNSSVPLQSATLSNGTLNATIADFGSLTLPLPQGLTTLPASGIAAGGNAGLLTGDTFLSADQSFFYADLISVASSGQQTLPPTLVVGGTPAPASALAAANTTQILAFNLPQEPQSVSQATQLYTLPFFFHDVSQPIDANASVSPLYMVVPAATAIGASGTSGTARVLNAGISIVGSGASQVSALTVTTGQVGTLQSSGSPIVVGTMRGVNLGQTLSSNVSSIPDNTGNSLYGTNTGISGFALSPASYTLGTSGIATAGTQTTATESEGPSMFPFTQNYSFAQPAVATTLPSGVGTSRTTQTLTGFFAGIMTTTAINAFPNAFNPSVTDVSGYAYAINGIATIATNATNNTVSASFVSAPLSTVATGGATSVVANFGPEQSAFIDDSHFGANESLSSPSQINGQNVTSQLYLVSANTAPPPASLLPTQSICSTCAFLQWGYWGGDLTTGPINNPSRVDHADINFWVAGPLTPVNQMPTTGTGSYAGGVVGTVVNIGNTYVASGSFTNTYNFGTNTGAFAINNFDGQNYAGTVNAGAASGVTGYKGTITGNGRSGAVAGAFFGPGATETGGTFQVQSVNSANYLASGVFGGKLTGPIH